MCVCLAGALLAVGITNCGVQDECDPAYALLCESVNHADDNVRIGAIMGLGLAYAGTQKAEVQVTFVPHTHDCSLTPLLPFSQSATTQSLPQSLPCSVTHSLSSSLTGSLTHLLTHLLVHSLSCSLTHLLSPCPFPSRTHFPTHLVHIGAMH